MRIHDEVGEALTIFDGSQLLLRYGYDQQLLKPSWTHLYTLSGHLISLHAPFDHLHHRGLMLTWSDINGINFWEEHRGPEQTGRIVLAEWLERRAGPDTAEVAARLTWRDPGNAPLLEQLLAFAVCASDHPGEWLLVIDTRLHALEQSVVFRTPPTYNGLGIRLARSLNVRPTLVNANGQEGEAATRGVPATWCDYTGMLDDGGGVAGVTIVGHPANQPHPVPFHTITSDMAFFAASPTFHQPKELGIGQSWQLTYLVAVHEGAGSPEHAEALLHWFTTQPRPLERLSDGVG
ncbi:MAG: PmoA family protein [Chloroflexi bacterium]|nr:PmoA family protein [Chloroflexota bacterium]